jgi:hypothetical protein
MMVFAEEIDMGEVEHVRRAGIEFVESILGWKGRIEELSNNSLGYQTFAVGEHTMHVGNAVQKGKDDMCKRQDEETIANTPRAKRLRTFSKLCQTCHCVGGHRR